MTISGHRKDVGVGINGFRTYNEAMQSDAAQKAQQATVIQSQAQQQYHPSAPAASTSVYAPVSNSSITVICVQTSRIVPDFYPRDTCISGASISNY